MASQLVPLSEVVHGGYCSPLLSRKFELCEGCSVRQAMLTIRWTNFELSSTSHTSSYSCGACFDHIGLAIQGSMDLRVYVWRAALSSMVLFPCHLRSFGFLDVCSGCGIGKMTYRFTMSTHNFDAVVRFEFCRECIPLLNNEKTDIERRLRARMIKRVVVLDNGGGLPRDVLLYIVRVYVCSLDAYLETIWAD